MHKHYIINNLVEFHPAASTLRDINNPDRVVVLNAPAGRCLLLLIERAGSIVTQQEFLDIVWQSRGMLVSSNTYYQNISILRKGLKKIGFEADPIVTIPRIGLTLASDIRISLRGPSPDITDTAFDRRDDARASEQPVLQPEGVVTAVSSGEGNRHHWLVGILAVLLLLAGVGVIGHTNARENRFVDDYRFAASIGACRVYLANDIQTQNERASALAYADRFKAGCTQHPWVYISWYALLPRASVIRCDRPMKEPNHCISDYFLEDR
ncbi:winged helix-turn-helix domain-containing protein [Enterobacter sp. UNJFSC 003]|uniref:winged helix-turn-helix domain-containing protein n=1 Tax=Enterobacter sp. UNJFSC 003 TaxID=3122077 RepID=UPI002EBCF23F|nr:winged helix-turn-helix domain-containing protein [Serratia liquefaciens]